MLLPLNDRCHERPGSSKVKPYDLSRCDNTVFMKTA